MPSNRQYSVTRSSYEFVPSHPPFPRPYPSFRRKPESRGEQWGTPNPSFPRKRESRSDATLPLDRHGDLAGTHTDFDATP